MFGGGGDRQRKRRDERWVKTRAWEDHSSISGCIRSTQMQDSSLHFQTITTTFRKKENHDSGVPTAAIQGLRTVKPDKPAERETPEEAKRNRPRGMRKEVGVERIANERLMMKGNRSRATTVKSRATRQGRTLKIVFSVRFRVGISRESSVLLGECRAWEDFPGFRPQAWKTLTKEPSEGARL